MADKVKLYMRFQDDNRVELTEAEFQRAQAMASQLGHPFANEQEFRRALRGQLQLQTA